MSIMDWKLQFDMQKECDEKEYKRALKGQRRPLKAQYEKLSKLEKEASDRLQAIRARIRPLEDLLGIEVCYM